MENTLTDSGRSIVSSTTARPIVRLQPANDNARPWRCEACGALLGIEQGGELHVKYKEAALTIVGSCRRVCRKCGTANELTVGAAPAATAPRKEEP